MPQPSIPKICLKIPVTFILGQFHEMPQPSIPKICLKITCLIFHSNFPGANELTHWGWVMHIFLSKLTIIGSDNGLSPSWCQAIIWTDAGILLIGLLDIVDWILRNKLQWNQSKCIHFHSRKCIWKCLENSIHFVLVSMCSDKLSFKIRHGLVIKSTEN